MGIRHSRTGQGTGLRSLVLAMKLPFPSRGGGDMRTSQTVDALGRMGPVEVIAPLGVDPAAGPPLAWLRDPLGHPADRWFTDAAAEEVARIGRELRPAVAVLETVWLHRYIDVLRDLSCKIVLNAHNLEGPLYDELAAGRGDAVSATVAQRAWTVEALAFATVDHVWVCSQRDAERARAAGLRDGAVTVVPNTLDVGRYEALARDERPATLLYPGNYGYPPNQAAARRLLEIFPAFAERVPGAHLVLLGSGATADMREAAARDARIEVTGAVDDALPFLASATVMPVPLLEGGGTRLKALEAFAAGVPVVSTAKGVEGLDVVAGEHYAAAESNDDFVRALADLCADPAARERLADRGRELVRERYSRDVARAAVAGSVERLDVL